MEGSGASGAVSSVGFNHLNMNINVGLGSVGVESGEATSDSGARSSSPLGGYGSANGIARAPSRNSTYESAPSSREPVGVSTGFMAHDGTGIGSSTSPSLVSSITA
ncbi:unnamed protein product, partial [Discosporangium mesarthrocarpum]